MVARMLLSENRCRISKPGVEVGSATPLQLLFSEEMTGLIPAAKGSFNGATTIALPEAGYVPIVYIVFNESGTYTATINAGKTTLSITGPTTTPSGRYVIFKNRQF